METFPAPIAAKSFFFPSYGRKRAFEKAILSSVAKIDGFSLLYRSIPFDFARAASDVEIKMWIKYNYLDWQNNPKIVELTPFKE